MYAIRTQVYLDTLTREYDTILSIDRMPTEATPLREMVRTLNTPPLSTYRTGISNPSTRGCAFALMMPSEARLFHLPSEAGVRTSPYMRVADLPILITLLGRWGYRVDTGMSQLMSKGGHNCGGIGEDRELICYITLLSDMGQN